MENKILLCPHNSCYSLPKISLSNNCNSMLITCNEHKGSNNRECEISDYLSKIENLLCTNCSNPINVNQYFFFCEQCKYFLCNKCYNKINSNHPHTILKKNIHNFWNLCIKHNLPYTKYCKTCAISFCKKCDESNHKKHILEDIKKKTEKEKEELNQNLLLQEEAFLLLNKIMNECLNNMKLEIKLKRLILNNYLNNEYNGNSIENLSQIYSPINNSFINYLNDSKNISFEDKLLIPFKFYEKLKGKKGKSDKQINNICIKKTFKNEIDDNNNANVMLNNNKEDKKIFINEQLYQKVLNHENLSKDIIDIINVEGDGNCFYRAISQFLLKNELFHQSIREEIFKKAQERERNDLKGINLLENDDLSATNYINNMQFDGGFAGDYEISIAHQLYGINIAVYRFKDDNDNDLSFIKFYNDDGNNKRDLLILIYINNNHYQLAYYKKKEIIKDNQIEGIHKLQQDISIKSSINNSNNNCTPTEKEKKTKTNKTKKTDNEKKENIITIQEQKVIYCMTRLSSGNLAIGLSNGLIKIYDINKLCEQINIIGYNNNEGRDALQTINNFRGKRISYLYELKDKTLLCATYGKIHHIQLINHDRSFIDLGFIKISPKELPKRIIELENELIISLSEKKYKHENLKREKCLIKVFNKLNKTDSQKEDEDNSFRIFSDIESIASCNINSSVEWENVYSSNDEDSFLSSIKKDFKEDSKIKLYKNNENKEDLFICSIFPIQLANRNTEYYEFMATSNKIFYKGENCIQIFGIIKKPNNHGFVFFIKTTISDVSCSRKVDSITKLNQEYIGIGLQNYDDNIDNGIAILDIKKKEIVRKIKGLNIGSLSKSYINGEYIIFSTNDTKDVKKSNLIRLYKIRDILKDSLLKEKDKIIFQLKSGFTCIEELFYEKGNNVIYAAANGKSFYIIFLKNN